MLRIKPIILILFIAACNSNLKTDLTNQKSTGVPGAPGSQGQQPVQGPFPFKDPGTDALVMENPSSGPQMQQDITPGQVNTVQFEGAKLEFEGDEVDQVTTVGVQSLNPPDLPPLDPGMTNVTKGPRTGYRFTPTPRKFGSSLSVTLPFDPALLPAGMTASDVQTYYYDTVQKRWEALERIGLDAENGLVTSDTDHFTDMINATVAVPDHPEAISFNPNQIKDIKAADPGTGINLIEPPTANNMGDARMNYPIELPPGRQGLAPQLSVNYNSGGGVGGNGWLGLGWDLSIPSISVDTRWGAARYDGNYETETYSLAGEQLTPVAHRGSLVPRALDKVFHTRVEGQFKRIIRRGSHPTNYTWEVTEKNGTVHKYGSCDPNTEILGSGSGRYLWALCETRDASGNFIRYTYALVSHPGVAGSGFLGTNLYPLTINYTGNGSTPGAYTVTFQRNQTRQDISIDARGGFKRVTADRLTKIIITFNGQQVRSYGFGYNENPYGNSSASTAFGKTLLTSISQRTTNDTLFNKHTFTYYDDSRDDGVAYNGFKTLTTWGAGFDNVSAGLLGRGSASALGGSKSTTFGGNFYFGGGFNDFLLTNKSLTAGFSASYSNTQSETLLAMVDINGDGLPDKVFKKSDGIYYRANKANPFGGFGFDGETKISGINTIGRDRTISTSAGAQGNLLFVPVIYDSSTSVSQSDTYLTDVNGDGLIDLVDNGQVQFGYKKPNGEIHFSADSNETPVAIGNRQMDASNLLSNMAALEAQRAANFPLLDSIRQWVAPYSGTIQVTGDVQLIKNTSDERNLYTQADGVKATIELGNSGLNGFASEVARNIIGANDYAAHSFSNATAISVSRGDRLYFRVNSVANGAYDQVSWAPVITYTQVTNGTLDLNLKDANNLPEYRYTAENEFTMAGKGSATKAPLNGSLQLGGEFIKKGPTTDDVSLVLLQKGVEVFRQNFGHQEVATVGIARNIPVVQLDDLEWKIIVDSKIDATKISFSPVAWYTAAEIVPAPLDEEGHEIPVPIQDENGKFIQTVNIPFDIDLYPVNSRISPILPYTVPAPVPAGNPDTRSMTVTAVLTFSGLALNETKNGMLVVKKRNALVAKTAFSAVGTNAPTLDVPVILPATVTTNDELFFEIDSRDTDFSSKITNIETVIGTQSVTAGINQRALSGLAGQSFRGWSYFGYNGSSPRDITPINQDLLVLNPDPHQDFTAVKVYGYNPEPGITGGRWGIMDNRGWITSTAISSTRIGIDDIRMPTGSQFAGAGAPPRMSQSDNTALGAVYNGSTGTSKSLIDFQDLNGDRFPDIIGESGVQYTNATGGFEPGQKPSISGGARQGKSSGGSLSLSGNTFMDIATVRGRNAPSGNGSAAGSSHQEASASLGFGGNLGSGNSTADRELIDMNGDGLPDMVFNDGTVALNLGYSFGPREGWQSGSVADGHTENSGINMGFSYGAANSLSGGLNLSTSRTSSSETFIDVNGDGLPDKLSQGSVKLNTGSGFGAPIGWSTPISGIAEDTNITLGGGGSGTFAIPCCAFIPVVKFAFSIGVNVATSMGRPSIGFRDMDGDGFIDHVSSENEGTLNVASNPIKRTNMLKKVERPMGATITLDYSRDGNTYELPQSRWNLVSVSVFDGHIGEGADTHITEYQYQTPHHDRLEREFFGYATVVEKHLNTEASNALYRSVTKTFLTDSYYSKGLLQKEQMTDAAGNLFTETENSYVMYNVEAQSTQSAPFGAATIFPQLVRTDKRFYEGTGSAQKSTYTANEYDSLGNITRFTDSGDIVASDDIVATISYSDCPTSYISQPTKIVVYGGGSLMRLRESTLDCTTGDVSQVRQILDGSTTVTTDLTYYANGNLKEFIGPVNKNGQRYKLEYVYDSIADTHVTKITDSFGLTSTADYDLRFGKPTTTTDTNAQRTTYNYDAAGRAETLVGPYEQGSGQVTINFDYFPDAAVPYAVTRHIDKDANGNLKSTGTIDTILFIDGLKRVLQTKKDAAIHTSPNNQPQESMVVTGQVVFDAFGRTVQQFYPVSENKGAGNYSYNTALDAVPPTRTVYDVLDRSVQTTLPDNTVTSSAYGFGFDRSGLIQFQTLVTDALGKQKLSYRDIRGLITSIKEFNQSQEIQTSYFYDALKQIVRVVDDKSNTTLITYDNLGRRTRIDNPDSGRTDSVYDPAGNLIAKITENLRADNLQIEYDYDQNRLMKIRYPIFTDNNVSYRYGGPELAGNANGNRAGRVTMVSDASGNEERFYGPLGETVKEVKTLPGAWAWGFIDREYVTEYKYDTWNRLMQITYPGAEEESPHPRPWAWLWNWWPWRPHHRTVREVLTYTYDSAGLVTKAAGKKDTRTYAYLSRLDYDKFGQRVYQEMGNGVKTNYAYRPDNRRLATLESQLPNPSQYQFQNLSYTYDAVGNITKIMNDVALPDTLPVFGSAGRVGHRVGGPSTQNYTYDDLYRLTGATGTYQQTPWTTNRYTLAMAYDSIHNITQKNQLNEFVNPGGAHRYFDTSYVNNYRYNNPKPHAASDIGPYDNYYDGNGNLIKRDLRHLAPDRHLVWDEENRLACVRDGFGWGYLPQKPHSCFGFGPRFVYNAAGTRVLKDGFQRSFTINEHYTQRAGQAFKHIFVGQQRLVTKRAENGDKREPLSWFFHTDHLQSTSYLTNSSGQLEEYLAYFPYGETWISEHATQPVQYQFSGKEYDPETGYYYFGARYYDPRVSTWVSTDPALGEYLSRKPDEGNSVLMPITLSLYTYGNQNPVKVFDADGRESYLITHTPQQDSEYPHSAIIIEKKSPNSKIEYIRYDFMPTGIKAQSTSPEGGPSTVAKTTSSDLKSLIKRGDVSTPLSTTRAQDSRMMLKADKIKRTTEAGGNRYQLQKNNCTDFVENVMKSSGKSELAKVDAETTDKGKKLLIGMPQQLENNVKKAQQKSGDN